MMRGFTSLEAIVGIFTFSILSVGVISLAVVGTRLALDSERRVVALALVNERVEFIRSLPYDQVALAPGGAIVQREDVSRNQQTYELETLVDIVDAPKNLKKKIQVTASWLVPAGGKRDVQVVTYVAALSAARSEQSDACIPGNVGWKGKAVAYTSNFLDNAFEQCKADCHQISENLPPWQCCGWGVPYQIDALRTTVKTDCNCNAQTAIPTGGQHYQPVPGGDEYTKLARQCDEGALIPLTACGKDAAGFDKRPQLNCDANCLAEPGDCVCQCPI